MSKTSKQTFRELSNSHLSEVYGVIDMACKKHGITCYLIGAQARDINLLESGIRPPRATMDTDFAIMLPDMDTYHKIVEDIMNSGFQKTDKPYRLIHTRMNSVIDLLPFGDLEENNSIMFSDLETELSVVGFKEVNEITRDFVLDNITIRVTPMEGLFILKLIAWDEKPVDRLKDLDDLQFILKNYFNLNQTRFYAEHLDCIDELPAENFQLGAGARLLGRDMAEALKRSKDLKTLIDKVLNERLRGNIGVLSEYSTEYFDDRDKLDQELIGLILKGINERI